MYDLNNNTQLLCNRNNKTQIFKKQQVANKTQNINARVPALFGADLVATSPESCTPINGYLDVKKLVEDLVRLQ